MGEPDIVVIGAGPAGGVAALHLADAGLATTLIDERESPGGMAFPTMADEEGAFLWPDRGYRASAFRQALHDRRRKFVYRAQTRAEAIAPGPVVAIRDLEGGAVETLSPSAVVVATGAIPIVPDLPGAMGLHDTAALVEAARERPGARVVLAGAGPLLWIAAARCLTARLKVVAIVDAAGKPSMGQAMGLLRQPRLFAQGLGWMRAVWKSGVPIHHRTGIVAVEEEGGARMARLAALDHAWRPAAGPRRTLAMDLLGIGYGLRPNLALLPAELPGVFVAGDAGGASGLDAALADGAIAAGAVLAKLGRQPGPALAAAIDEARRQRRRLDPFLRALHDWSGPRGPLAEGGQRDR